MILMKFLNKRTKPSILFWQNDGKLVGIDLHKFDKQGWVSGFDVGFERSLLNLVRIW